MPMELPVSFSFSCLSSNASTETVRAAQIRQGWEVSPDPEIVEPVCAPGLRWQERVIVGWKLGVSATESLEVSVPPKRD